MGGNRKAVVIGAGIGGLAAAVALRRVGFEVEVFERAPELRAAGFGLSVMSNATAALAALDIDLGLEKRGRVMETYHVKDHKGRLIREFPFPEITRRIGVPCVCISRADLLAALLDQAADVPITLGATAERFEVAGDRARVRFTDGAWAEADVLIGADGFNSAIRRQITGPGEPARDSGYIAWLGITDYSHPRFAPGSVVHLWGDGMRFGLVDIGRGRLYWWGTKNMPYARSSTWDEGKAGVLAAYSGWPDEVREAIRVTPPADLLTLNTRDRPFLRPWGDGPVTLLGDAAHPMLTSLGQGSAMAMEDAAVLALHLRHAADVPSGLRGYEAARYDRTRTIVEATRSISDFEQSQGPVRRRLRDAYFRWMPHRSLVGKLEPALTFPGAGLPSGTGEGANR
ncbi:FAD-dependent monooxygenase [Streptomyces cinereoruber]|uniref:FAD-binding protein n=1 Tax=Streptomyces cinereoruber TaxID=67260 RepID=A0AAV4KTN3_9ACTN|nr:MULTISPECIES: FAD-dependent monooxygenase [Streptomyces]AVH94781.1 FAD-binding protein [Streptomyces sp. WAC00288]KYG53503.1 FAD-dependent monooxygenase [Streptomyces sp. WAC04657]MBB4157553.1 2-polyprenyl-6-methoxyphenol hydroxylase-like FAD-dependent oxidoreductase [Streptomyces cinereoruber]MBY8819918.1 FAD-dependent monooxygenase [Streptomyces cinereoruber]NIH62294.1 2-polyprenyl-6-methoxyphenol hydroxylase-like FAD-dependent oxidoreductase [Streptomyces cinereoruber]